METPTSPSSMRHSPPLQDHGMVPMAEIESPYENDVLSGRGVTTNRHPGNINFRQLVSLNKELYVTSTKRQKMSISKSIVEAVRSMDPPGRFLEKNPETGLWSDIGDKKAIEKTSQALRDGAASLRKQLSEDLGDPDFLSAVFDMDVSESKTGGGKDEKGTTGKAKEKEPSSSSSSSKEKEKGKEEKTSKTKPTVAKGHRRIKSNPTVGVTARAKSMTALRKAGKAPDMSLSPTSRKTRLPPTSPTNSQPLSPEREEQREPFQSPTSPRSQPCSPQTGWANRANWKRRSDRQPQQQQQRVPSETHDERIPDRYFSSSPFHRVDPSGRGMYDRSHSFEQPPPPYRHDAPPPDHPRHHHPHPPPPGRPYDYGPPGYPPGPYRPGPPPPPPPMGGHPTSPLPPGSHHFSPNGYQSKPPLSPPSSAPWSPRGYSGHSPHHSMQQHPPPEYRRHSHGSSPKYRFSPGGGYQIHHRPGGPYSSAAQHPSLHVPVLGGERPDGRRSMPSSSGSRSSMPPGSSSPSPSYNGLRSPHYDQSPRNYPPSAVPIEFTPPPSRVYNDNHHHHHHHEPDYPHSRSEYDDPAEAPPPSPHYQDHHHYHHNRSHERDRRHSDAVHPHHHPQHNQHHHSHYPEEETSDMDAQVYVEELPESNTKLEIREDSIEATPSMLYDRDSSPSAVADVAPSEAGIKKDDEAEEEQGDRDDSHHGDHGGDHDDNVDGEEYPDAIAPSPVTKSGEQDDVSVQSDCMSRAQDRDGNMHDDENGDFKNPAYDDASISPLPFDYESLQLDDPESLMDIPDNIMSLPIAQFEPLEPGAA